MKISGKAIIGVALSIAVALGSVSPASALRGPTEFQSLQKLTEKGKARAPKGLLIFCLSNRQHCRGGGASQVYMSASLMRVLELVNNRVNHTIHPRYDPKGDVWSINVASGDCEDYVLTKRDQLIRRGVSASALRIATARTRSGAGHAVLVVRTSTGDFVLDNRTKLIKEWNKTDLDWVAMSGGSPRKWHAV